MKCPKCGTYNGKTNKFCRECGLHLAWVVEDENLRQDSADAVSEDVVLGEALADVYDCYESGDLDVALAGAEKIANGNPDSTSAHGILALIYERKGEIELEAGDSGAARHFLTLGLAEYEKIIDLNPDSAADREKLSALRVRLNGGAAQASLTPRRLTSLKSMVRSIPPQMLAAGVAFIVILMLTIVLLPGGDKATVARPLARGPESEPQSMPMTRSGSESLTNSTSVSASPSLKVYTFPAPSQASTPIPPAPKPAERHTSMQQPEVKPAKLPSFGNELTIVPESKKKPEKAAAKIEAVQPKPATSSAPKEDATPKVDGTSLLAAAIRMRNQGRTQEAIDTAQQAITYFRAEVDAGTNVTSAKRGIDNAGKLISLWQQAL
jgi:tetratricopeptide (TPR) repeat protein